MKDHSRIANEKLSTPFQAADGATVFELLSPKNSIAKNISIASGYLESGKFAKPHFHKVSEEIYYILSGRGQIRFGTTLFDIKTGDAIIVPVEMIHALINTDQEKPLKVLAIETPAYSDDDIFFVD
jgi:mannose-6-phosphate isomerase-like protein (cupin superfamily)